MNRPTIDVKTVAALAAAVDERLDRLESRLANLETRIRHFEVIEDRAAREEEQRERALSRESERRRRGQ